MSLTEDLFTFIKESPTAFHTVAAVKRRLAEHGFEELSEREHWELSAGNGYFTTRNDSSLIAFRIPDAQVSAEAQNRMESGTLSGKGQTEGDFSRNTAGFHIAAAHSDFPALKVKEFPEIDVSGKYTKLNVEKYGGMLCAPWFDRPLSIAGRVVYDISCLPGEMALQKENSGDAFRKSTEADRNDGEKGQGDMFQRRTEPGSLLGTKLVNIDRDLVMIPNLAIHMNRQANDGYSYNAQKDMLPLFAEGVKKGRLKELAAEAAGIPAEAILASDLFLYNRMEGTQWGEDKEFISAPRLDDLQCAYALLCGFLKGKNNTGEASENLAENIPLDSHISVYALFDNEEVGSVTKQGADSTFLSDVLYRIAIGLGKTREEYMRILASSFMVSADNAHALHPNFPDKADPSNQPVLNGGIVIKYNANQKYTTDAVSSGYFQMLCRRANVPYQTFFNRSDMAGGSTLGNISNKKVSIHTVDIGLPQLAMHSPYETAGSRDTEYLIHVMEEFYSCS